MRAIRSEMIKLWRPRLLLAFAAAGIASMCLGAAFTIIGATGGLAAPAPGGQATLSDLESTAGLGAALSGGQDLLGVIALAFLAWSFGFEWSLGTLKNLLVRYPRPARLLAAKLLVGVLLVAALTALSAPLGVGAAALTAQVQGVDVASWWTMDGMADAAATVGRLMLASAGYGVLGAVLAIALRSPVMAIGIGLAYALPLETLVSGAFDEIGDWLPGRVFGAFARGGGDIGLAPAMLAGAIYVAAALALAGLVVRRRGLGTS